MKQFIRRITPYSICLFLGMLYWLTLAPGLTWAFDGADGGDLVTAAATGGVPHPSGYPTYLLLASLFLKLPFGSLAYRTNLLSCICTLAAALVIYKIMRSADQSVFSAAIAALAFGTFPLVWSQAILTEVYALNALFATLLLYFLVVSTSNPWMDWMGGIIMGLGLGNHLTLLFFMPLMFFDKAHKETLSFNKWLEKGTLHSYIKRIARRLVGLLLGLTVYFVIPLRARTHAPVNWGNAVSWEGWIWLISSKMYWGRLNDLNGRYLWAGVQAWSYFLVKQLGIVGFFLIFIVLALLLKPSRLYLASVWLVLVYSAFSILYYSPDSYVYLIPALISFSIWMGLGSEWITERSPSKFPYFKPMAIFGILAFLVIRAILAIPAMNLSADHTVERYAQLVLNSAPARAVIFTEGDEATFSLWYFHYAYHQRPDIAVVCDDLLVQPWYRDVLKQNYPDLVVPEHPQEQDIIRDNPQRTMCQLAPDLQASLKCLP
jgi:Protein of unknown function (DUF2723)